jgi:hypothetical protein
MTPSFIIADGQAPLFGSLADASHQVIKVLFASG